jgi:threonylcarbamoyladenosine tRNA methylthiotransferase MtaB
MRYIIATLGCKVNQYESEAMEQLLRSRGHSRCAEGESPDVLIVNTCAVTAEGARKARQTVRRLQRQYPGALLALCGCWSQVDREAARAMGPEVLFGTGDRKGFVEAVEAAAERREGAAAESWDDPFRRREFEELPAGAYEGHARAYLKIQDGCDNFCAYCVIPYARGRVRSLPKDRCAAQAAELAAKGYREIVVTGIEAASWGKDLKTGESLADAVEAVAAAAPGVRLHLGSLAPTAVTADFVRRMAALNVCPHFHLSLQSGCDATLKRMRRKYDTEEFFAVTERLRAAFPGCALTTDLICGFPGETEEEFAATLAFLERCDFAAMHIFPYSVRPGTKAADMPGQLDRETKAARCRRVQELAGRMRGRYLRAQIGQVRQVLFETEKEPGLWLGHTENYLETEAAGDALRGLVKKVKITGARGEILVGTAL